MNFTSWRAATDCTCPAFHIYFSQFPGSEQNWREIYMGRLGRFLCGCACVVLLASSLPAQSIYGTLTGIVSDPSEAVVANAAVKLRDMQSGSQRDTVTNSGGFYTFVSVPPGAYEITVS